MTLKLSRVVILRVNTIIFCCFLWLELCTILTLRFFLQTEQLITDDYLNVI